MSNKFWEGNLAVSKPGPQCDKSDRHFFIQSKYESKHFVKYSSVDDNPSRALYEAVQTPDLLRSIELITAGAVKDYTDPQSGLSMLQVARLSNQRLQEEVLLHNGFKDTFVSIESGMELVRDVGEDDSSVA